MSEQKPEYVVFAATEDDGAAKRLTQLAAEGYEYVGQSTGVIPDDTLPYWTTWTMRLRPEWRQEPVPLAVQDDRLEVLEKRLWDAEGMIVSHEEQIGTLELRKLHERLTALESRQRRLEAKIGRAFWTNAEINGMKCRVLVSARTEETGHE